MTLHSSILVYTYPNKEGIQSRYLNNRFKIYTRGSSSAVCVCGCVGERDIINRVQDVSQQAVRLWVEQSDAFA